MEFEVVMPRLGSEMTEGSVARWLKQEGELVEKGEPLMEIETEKAVVSVESMATGVLTKIMVTDPEAVIPVGQVIGVIETS
jgi:pyruvate/2-oxoglutarate dehydrogenase complex dihydrolipoamide acyltransferase (E2) component